LDTFSDATLAAFQITYFPTSHIGEKQCLAKEVCQNSQYS